MYANQLHKQKMREAYVRARSEKGKSSKAV